MMPLGWTSGNGKHVLRMGDTEALKGFPYWMLAEGKEGDFDGW